jgi:hypothetical protein
LAAALLSGCGGEDSAGPGPIEGVPTITLVLTVDGSIQTDDPWTTGSTTVNEWAKPMYRIWLDMNGDPNDGPYGNGAGPKEAEIWLDTGRLGFRWYGPNGTYGDGDDVEHWPLYTIGTTPQTAEDVTAGITGNGSALEVSFPLEKIGDPATLEVRFMASPWTTSASDNLGQGAASAVDYIVVSDATQLASHSQDDPVGDNTWPTLDPNREVNFDLVKAEVNIEEK